MIIKGSVASNAECWQSLLRLIALSHTSFQSFTYKGQHNSK